MIAYHRTALAQQLVQALQGRLLLGDAHNGLFLAAPRRTGKSTFLQGDLAPALQQAGVDDDDLVPRLLRRGGRGQQPLLFERGGHLGDGSTVTRAVPTLVGSGYASVAAGIRHAAALKTDGSLWAWGQGYLGNGNFYNAFFPEQIGTSNDWANVAVNGLGLSHTLALKADRSLWYWGLPSPNNGGYPFFTTPFRAAPHWYSHQSTHRSTLHRHRTPRTSHHPTLSPHQTPLTFLHPLKHSTYPHH